MDNKENLFEEFAPVPKKNWLEKVEKDLKGKAPETLQWPLESGITLDPFYTSSDTAQATIVPHKHAEQNDWAIGENFAVDDWKTTNQVLLDALLKGVNAPCLLLSSIPNASQWEILLKDIELSYIQLHLDGTIAQEQPLELLQSLQNYLGDASLDLVGSLAFQPQQQQGSLLDGLQKYATTHFPQLCYFDYQQVSTTSYVDQLFDLIRRACDTLDQLSTPHYIQFTLEIGTSYFAEIAKIRALRLLWANVLHAYEIEEAPPIFIRAISSQQTYGEDQHTNMIRATTIAMSAVIGGVDQLTIGPADGATGTPFTRRIARNVQHLLKMESYFDRVIDPAAGSFYVEELTRRFATATWKKMENL